MGSMHCRLYDENLVHNIIMNTGLAVSEYFSNNHNADPESIFEYLETHADAIIQETIDQMNTCDDFPEKDDSDNSWNQPT